MIVKLDSRTWVNPEKVTHVDIDPVDHRVAVHFDHGHGVLLEDGVTLTDVIDALNGRIEL